MGYIRHQIGQCRVNIERERTIALYADLPLLSESCSSAECAYFLNTTAKLDLRLWTILRSMRIDLRKVQGPSNGGLICTGPTEKYNHCFQGRYMAYGLLGKTQHTPQELDENGELASVDFYESEQDANVRYQIKKEPNEMLSFNFILECERR